MTHEEAIKQLYNVTIYHQGKCTREALDIAIDAIKKQIPKKIIKRNDPFWEYQCPNTNCNTRFASYTNYEHCPGCGQAIDWGVSE